MDQDPCTTGILFLGLVTFALIHDALRRVNTYALARCRTVAQARASKSPLCFRPVGLSRTILSTGTREETCRL